MVEGYLRKWVNIVHGWKPRYFIIHNGLLFICDHKGGKRKGTVALKISTISTTPEDPLRMIIFTGTNEVHIKAEDAKDMKKWYQALIEAQEDTINREDMQGYQQEKEIESFEKRLSPQTKKSMSKSSNLDTLKEKLAELWVHQAEFDETLSLVAPKVKSIPHLSENMSKLEQIGRDLKYNVTECVNMIEAEKKRMLSLAYQFESANASGGADVNKRLDFGGNNYGRNLEENDDSNDTEFHSFESDDDDEEEEEAKVFEGFERPTSRQPTHSQGRDLEPIHLGSALSPTKSSVQLNPHVKHLITANPVYLETPISKEPKRDKLPFVLDPNQKFNVWAVAKDLIGKDLSRFAVPVWLNEPLSMLQKLCEQIEYHNLLDIGAQKEDSCMRMAYVMAFAFAYNASTTGRLKKPFNPILGETYEFVEGGVKFISEQVSHHPPISAGYAEGNHFEWWGDAQIKTAFKGTSLEVKAAGSCHAVLKPHGDHFIYKRPTTGVHNIIIGQMYIDNYGDMPFSNSKTGDTGQLTLKKRGWGDKGAYEAEGWIKNKSGTIKYHLAGKWNSHLTLIDAVTKQETRIWTRTPLSEQAHLYYNFSTFAMQLNHLHEDLVPRLAATDCRFRPDQRALEHGFYDLARDEKFRLEEKQRARRKELQAKGETHKARWFEEIKDSVTGEKEYKYLGGYFECREKKIYGDILNLFD